jgi:hypothetical protein
VARTRERTLDRRTLNRTLLARQLLLDRRRTPVVKTIEHLVALQAQEPRDPYVALWTRLHGFDAGALSRLLERRKVARMTLLRGTLHLATADDALAIRPVVQPAIEATFYGSSPLRRAIDAVDADELVSFVRARLEEEPRTRAQLVRVIADRWPEVDADAVGYAMYLIPTVQVTPRGLWGRTGPSAFTTLETWLGRMPGQARAPDDVLLRYLRAFGPATPADAQTWSGLRAMREVFERLRPQLRVFRDEAGRALFDVPRAPIADPDLPAPVRFLPEYDNVVLAHKDRSRIAGHGTSIWTEVGWGLVLVDGFTAARWKIPRGSHVMDVEPFRRLSVSERDAVEAEGQDLARFLLPEGQVSVQLHRGG